MGEREDAKRQKEEGGLRGRRTLKKPEATQVWDFVYEELKFSPSVSRWPGFREPTPSVTFALPERWSEADVRGGYR
ncbi:DUF2716 domain-containing protein [Deinococcus sp. HMF7620]|uniref:DUF2716 domain-containing protein n=1 Tax=Deinococcus arboris TaxID=2682977 RepID=A0A7C9HSK9_9DEIO|nr:DUF2716 domain-containing protein [Deinococcus arboris]